MGSERDGCGAATFIMFDVFDTMHSSNLPNSYLPTYALPIILSLSKLHDFIFIFIFIFYFFSSTSTSRTPPRGDKPRGPSVGRTAKARSWTCPSGGPAMLNQSEVAEDSESRTLEDNCDRLCRSCYVLTSKRVRAITGCYRGDDRPMQ